MIADPAQIIDKGESFVSATGADIRHGGNEAFYQPSGDYIALPEKAAFTGTASSSANEAYYSTLLHELTHWSGAKKRCDRDLSGRFGDASYSTSPAFQSDHLDFKGYEYRPNFEPPQQDYPAASVAHFLTAAYSGVPLDQCP